MAEMALYRKYRPRDWPEVIGQDQVVKVLAGALKAGNISHAYLFAGPRGTGKTSVARILARALKTKDEDLYEIDAASNRGIDEARALREAVQTLPFNSPYKVYIIDEVHMLTKDAFNALLKTLEEPPPHVIFILATTELPKVLETIVSRCQTFTFRKPSNVELVSAVTAIARAEGYKLEPAAAGLLALLGDGSFRDALGALQKAMAVCPPSGRDSSDKKIVALEVATVFGAPPAELVASFAWALVGADVPRGLGALRAAAAANADFKLFLKLVLRLLRLALLLRLAPKLAAQMLEGEGEEKKVVEDLSLHPNADRLAQTLRELLAVYDELGRSYLPELPLELALVRIAGGAV